MINPFNIDNLREIGATLSRNKTRTFLTAFGIFWGTAMLAILLGGGRGLNRIMRSNFEGFATNTCIVWAQPTTLAYKGYRKGNKWYLTINDIERLRRGVPEIEYLVPTAFVGANARYHTRSFATSLQGITPDYAHVSAPKMLSGRFLNASDQANAHKVCVLGQKVAADLFGDADPLGSYIEVDGIYYNVIGVAKQKTEVQINAPLDESVLIPLSTLQRTYSMGDKIDMAMFTMSQGTRPGQLKPRILDIIRSSHPIHPDDVGAVAFFDASEMFEMVDNVFMGLNLLLLFVGLSSLIAGVIGVGNIMWIVVRERTQEFGIRRAIGALPSEIITQILAESTLLTAVSGMAGLCFAVGVMTIADSVVHSMDMESVSFVIPFGTAVGILVTFVVLGSAAGLIPALKAMKIKPIEALNAK